MQWGKRKGQSNGCGSDSRSVGFQSGSPCKISEGSAEGNQETKGFCQEARIWYTEVYTSTEKNLRGSKLKEVESHRSGETHERERQNA